jgi:rhamnose utilization protein RhaD (predicted bifunctional aldolase and dehydrogenase)
MVNAQQALANISSFAGNRFDLAQAGGGNSSVKLDENQMLIKASGISLSEVTDTSGFVCVDYSLIRQSMASNNFCSQDRKERERLAEKLMVESKLSDEGKPSIETFLHALLDTFTLHTHPLTVNVITAKEDWKSELESIWPDAIYVPYHTPGIDLALALEGQIELYRLDKGEKPKVIFLQNHGLIISSPTYEEVEQLTESVCIKIEKKLSMNLERYRQVSQLQTLFSKLEIDNVKILCNDDHIIQECLGAEDSNVEIWPFCPDTLIYCGVKPVCLSSITDTKAIQEYLDKFQEYPKVIILNTQVYFCANSLKKAKDAQDLFKFHLTVRQYSNSNIQRLTLDEVAYLSNWDAEKYRQGL